MTPLEAFDRAICLDIIAHAAVNCLRWDSPGSALRAELIDQLCHLHYLIRGYLNDH